MGVFIRNTRVRSQERSHNLRQLRRKNRKLLNRMFRPSRESKVYITTCVAGGLAPREPLLESRSGGLLAINQRRFLQLLGVTGSMVAVPINQFHRPLPPESHRSVRPGEAANPQFIAIVLAQPSNLSTHENHWTRQQLQASLHQRPTSSGLPQ